jgi:hypothetical protein
MIGVVFNYSLAPLYVFGALVLLVLLLAIFLGLGHGRYAEILAMRIGRTRKGRTLAVRWYIKDLEKTNPVAARAVAKVERVSGGASVSPGEAALSVLTAAERRAYLELLNDRAEHPLNRAQRRHATGPGPKPARPLRH